MKKNLKLFILSIIISITFSMTQMSSVRAMDIEDKVDGKYKYKVTTTLKDVDSFHDYRDLIEKQATSLEKENKHMEINLPIIHSQTISISYEEDKIGDFTIITRAASFSKESEIGRIKDFYHITQQGLFYPDNSIIAGKNILFKNHRLFGFKIGAIPNSIVTLDENNQEILPTLDIKRTSLIENSPQTTMRETKYTSQVGFKVDIGASVGELAFASVNYSTTHTKTIHIEDIQVRNMCGNEGRAVEWIYEVKNTDHSDHKTSPSSISSLQFYNQWAWAFDHEEGFNSKKTRKIKFTPHIEVYYGDKNLFEKKHWVRTPKLTGNGIDLKVKSFYENRKSEIERILKRALDKVLEEVNSDNDPSKKQKTINRKSN